MRYVCAFVERVMIMKLKKPLILLFSICFILASVTGVLFVNFQTQTSLAYATDELPSYFQNDYQNLDYVSSVKDQGSTGMCWAFSAVATAEADAIKNHGADKSQIDLSEWHLAYFLYHGERTGTGDSVEYTNTEPYYSIGGNGTFVALALSNWIGFADESVAPFSTLSKDKNATISSDKMNQCSYIVNNVQLFDVETDRDEMKRAVIEHGAIMLSYNQDSSYFNSNTSSQYCNIVKGANHMVTVVGFDDGYARENFKFSSRPDSDGAWLVKNSYGSGWGKAGGYFWLSYEDMSINEAVSIDVLPASEYENNYQHDGGIYPAYLEHNAGVKSNYANVFTAKSKEILKAVGVYIQGINEEATEDDYNYTIRIYKNPKTLSVGASDISLGTPVSTVNGRFKSQGYFTIPLANDVYLEEDDVFVIELETSAFIAIDMSDDVQANTSNGVQTIGKSIVSVGENQSYVKEGSVWRDVCNKFSNKFNFRIKGFTVGTEVGETVVKTLPQMRASISYGEVPSDDLLSGGTVVDGDTGKVLDGVWSFKEKSVMYGGQRVEVIFTPKDKRYQTAKSEIYATVKKTKPTLDISDIDSTVCIGARVYLDVVAVNPFNTELDDFNAIKLYYQYNGGVKNEIYNNVFVVPNGTKDGTVITFSTECAGDNYKYESADVETKTVTVNGQFIISETPSVSNVAFGQKLSCSEITGGVVKQTSSNATVEGVWTFNDADIVPNGTTAVKLDFVDNEGSTVASTFVNVTTSEDSPIVNLQVDKQSCAVGDKLKITVELKNKYSEDVNGFGKYTVYYVIDDGDEMVKIANESSFVVPASAKGKNMKIIVVVEGVKDKYLEASACTEIAVSESKGLFDCFSGQMPTELFVVAILPSILFVVFKKVKAKKEE